MTVADLKVEGVSGYKNILDIEIVESAHCHGVCKLSLLMKDDFKASEVVNWSQKQLSVKTKEGGKFIFCGIITAYEIEIQSCVVLTVTVETLSAKLAASKEQSATFQKNSKKISDILNEVKKTYSGSDISCATDKQIAELVYRDNLTDWDFLRELAEMQGQILFCSSKTDRLTISLGFKAFKEFQDKDLKFVRQISPLKFCKRLEKNTYSSARPSYFVETDFFTYNAEIGVGCGVKYDNQTQAVIASHVFVNNNLLCNEIKIRHKEGCRADAWDVTKFFDRFYYLTGTVLESADTNVKVHFNCDAKQEKNDALNIPFESVLSNYLYTMPDEKDKVFVYCDRNRQSAMGSLRSKDVADKAEDRSFKTKEASMIFDSKKISFAASDKADFTEEGNVKLTAKKNIVFSAKGDIYLQSAAGSLPDNQITMATPHFVGYGIYTAMMGQPASVQFNPAGATVGKVQATVKNGGTKKEDVELSDLAKELDKITGRKNKQAENKSSSGGSGGSVKLEGKKEFVLNVKNSFVGLKGSNTNIKTRVFNTLGYIPAGGGGTGSLSKYEGGSPDARSESIKAEQGKEDHSRQKEKIQATKDNKNISV